MLKIKKIIKQDTILVVATLLAIVSCFFTIPDKKYITYIDYRTLILLFCLMCVMSGFKEIGLFEYIARTILQKTKTIRGVMLTLVLLCFFSSMIITNDVSLITFVPIAIMIINISDLKKQSCVIVSLMTIAANLGSMLTPLGNPQNLYLFNKSKHTFKDFILIMLPYALIALIILIFIIFIISIKSSSITINNMKHRCPAKKYLIIYSLLFFICLLTVFRILNIFVLLFLIVLSVFIVNKNIFRTLDYSLLLTFTAFFIFIGNMGRFMPFNNFLNNIITGNELVTAIIASQIISNVPAALLLSGFTNNWNALIIGTNIGGLGTLIASMASLISYKQIAKNYSELRLQYISQFTILNILFLIIYGVFIIIP